MGANMNYNCRGCLSLMSNRSECSFTRVGIESFPNCPCQTCLIKTVCGVTCDDFIKVHHFAIQYFTPRPEVAELPTKSYLKWISSNWNKCEITDI